MVVPMPLLNANLPRHFYAAVRAEFLHNQESHHGQTVPCVVFGVASQRNRALAFHVMLENGSQFARIPLHAIATRPTPLPMPSVSPISPISALPPPHLSDLCAWDCFGDEIAVTEFDYLREMSVTAFLPGGSFPGVYLCSFDWLNNGFSDTPEQHKVMHLIALHCGVLALQPNYKLRWTDASFTTPYAEKPGYVANTWIWRAEQ